MHSEPWELVLAYNLDVDMPTAAARVETITLEERDLLTQNVFKVPLPMRRSVPTPESLDGLRYLT
jgi:hypothetical protein